jgi:hypothetical protein
MTTHKVEEVEEGGDFEHCPNPNLWTPPMQCALLANPSPWLCLTSNIEICIITFVSNGS